MVSKRALCTKPSTALTLLGHRWPTCAGRARMHAGRAGRAGICQKRHLPVTKRQFCCAQWLWGHCCGTLLSHRQAELGDVPCAELVLQKSLVHCS